MAAAAYVPELDSAWDRKRILAEKAFDNIDRSKPDSLHPYMLYFLGLTRFDLNAGKIGEYLDLAKGPEIWRMRRLTLDQREADKLARGRLPNADKAVFLAGVVALENHSGENGAKLARLLAVQPRDNDAVWAAVEDYAADAVDEIAEAVRRLSMDLTPYEKKAFDVPAGAG